MTKYVIIEKDGEYQAHKKTLGFVVSGPSVKTQVCKASTFDKCLAILKSKSADSTSYRTIEEISL